MGQLIAIIFSIILGALATALTIVYIGSGFSDKSAEIKAQQVLQAGSQLEAAMTVYRAENAATAFTNNLAETVDKLDNLLKSIPIAPQGVYELDSDGFLFASDTVDNVISVDVCNALSSMNGGVKVSFNIDFSTSLGDARFGCITDNGDSPFTLIYNVE